MIPLNIEKEHIIKAIGEIDSNGVPSGRQSIKFCIRFEEKQYSPKYVLSLANKFANGEELDPSSFNGGQETNNFLKRLEFDIVEISSSRATSESISPHKDTTVLKPTDQEHTEHEPDMATKKENRSSGKTQKDFLFKLLKQRFGCVVTEAKFDWLKVPDRASKNDVFDEIYEKLVSIRGQKDFSTSNYKLECDYFIPSHNLIIEYDERQHFTIQRAESLAYYPSDLNFNFDKDKWCEASETIRATDKKPIYRDEQRAFYDSVRDILAARNGITLIRIKDRDYNWDLESGADELNILINSLKLDASPSNIEEAIEELAWDFSCIQKAYRDWTKQFKTHEDVICWLKNHNIGECSEQDELKLRCSHWNPITLPVLHILVPDCIKHMSDQFTNIFNKFSNNQISHEQIWYLLYFLHPVRHELYFFDIHYPDGYALHLSKLIRSHRLGLKSARSFLCNKEGRTIDGSHISACGTVAFKHLHIHPTTSKWGEPNLENLTKESVLALNLEDGDISSEEQTVAIDISARAKTSFKNWLGYAPCAINEGPIFTLKKGKKHLDCFEAIVEILNGSDHKQATMRAKLKEFYEIKVTTTPCV